MSEELEALKAINHSLEWLLVLLFGYLMCKALDYLFGSDTYRIRRVE